MLNILISSIHQVLVFPCLFFFFGILYWYFYDLIVSIVGLGFFCSFAVNLTFSSEYLSTYVFTLSCTAEEAKLSRSEMHKLSPVLIPGIQC